MEITERDMKDCALQISNLCEARGLSIRQTGQVCEFIIQCVCTTEIIMGTDI